MSEQQQPMDVVSPRECECGERAVVTAETQGRMTDERDAVRLHRRSSVYTHRDEDNGMNGDAMRSTIVAVVRTRTQLQCATTAAARQQAKQSDRFELACLAGIADSPTGRRLAWLLPRVGKFAGAALDVL